MRALRWSDVDLNDGSIVVSKSAAVRVRYPDGPTKGGKVRNVFMSEEFRKALIEHRRRLSEEALKKTVEAWSQSMSSHQRQGG